MRAARFGVRRSGAGGRRAGASLGLAAASGLALACSTPPPDAPFPGPPPIELVAMPAESPAVTIRLVFASGSADDPAGLEGLTRMAVRLMVEGGTESLTYHELLRRLYPMAAELSWNVERDQSLIYARVPAEQFESFYPVFVELLTKPRMAEQDFERLRAVTRSELEDELKVGDDEELGKEALQAFLYAGHPYGHPPLGTSAGLAAMTVERVREQRTRTLCSLRATLGVAGGLSGDRAKQVANDLTELLPSACTSAPPLPPPPAFTGRQVLIVDKPGNSATAMSLGFPVRVDRAQSDFSALALGVVYFGQHRQFVGRLMQQIRERRGFNYGDYAYPEHFEQDGGTRYPATNVARRQQLFSIWLRPVKPEHAHFVLRLALHELERFVADGIPADEFDRVRTFALGYFNLYRQTESRRLGYALDDRFYGLTRPFLDGLLETWPTLDPSWVRERIARLLTAQDVKIAIVAPDGAALAEALAADEPSPVTYDSPKGEEILAEDEELAVLALGIPRENIRVVPVADLFAR